MRAVLLGGRRLPLYLAILTIIAVAALLTLRQPLQHPAGAQQATSPRQQPPVRFVLEVRADAPNATAVIDGELHRLPALLEVVNGSTVVIEPQPSGDYEPVNRTVTVRVTGDTTLQLKYRRAYVYVHVLAEAPVLVNGTPIHGDATLRVRANTTLTLSSSISESNGTRMVSDRVTVKKEGRLEDYRLNTTIIVTGNASITVHASKYFLVAFNVTEGALFSVNGTTYNGSLKVWWPAYTNISVTGLCRMLDEEKSLCITGWNGSGLEFFSKRWPWFIVKVDKPLSFTAITYVARNKYPSERGEVLYNNKTVKVYLVSGYRDMVVPFQGEYRYLGDGWWLVKGEAAIVYLQPPGNWTRAKVHIKAKGGGPVHNVMLVLKARPKYSATGWWFYEGEFVFTFINNVGRGEVLYANGDYGECWAGLATGLDSVPLETPGVDAGWLEFRVHGEVYFKVEFQG